jgi:hypothetical protein
MIKDSKARFGMLGDGTKTQASAVPVDVKGLVVKL